MIEEILYQKLSTNTSITDIVSTRIYPIILPEKTTYPAITYLNITDIPHNHLKGESGVQNARFQIDIWAKSYAEIKTLYLKVKAGINDISLVLGTREDYEKEANLYKLSADFSIWNEHEKG